MNRVLHKNHTPNPGAFRYKDDDTGVVLEHPYYIELQKLARRHRKANDKPYLSDDAFEENVCRQKPEICGEEPPKFLTRAATFAKAMAHWASKGFPIVTEEQAAERLAICEPCPYFAGLRTFGVSCAKCGCSKLALWVASKKCPDNPPRWNAIK